jgi:16S rRNA processing protein RimM
MSDQTCPLDVNTQASTGREFVAIARITRTRGLRGEVRADLLTDFPERFSHLREVGLQLPGGERLTLQLEEHWFHQGRLILKFIGYDTIEQAQSLVGGILQISEEELVELENDEFFHFQLVGCDVFTMKGARVGRVTKVMETAGTPLLVVDDAQGSERLIPFAESICPEVDIEAKQIRIDPPDGLLDL